MSAGRDGDVLLWKNSRPAPAGQRRLPHSLFLFTPGFRRNVRASFFLSHIFHFLCISCSFISDVFSFLSSDAGDLSLWSL